jgi:5-methylcytosine-specific restriction enzyme subunit McrC
MIATQPEAELRARPARVVVRLPEWSALEPSMQGPGRVLMGQSFESAPALRSRASELDRAGVVTIRERIDGFVIETRSFVGRVSLGRLDITIVPKISWGRWLTLANYAYRLRDVIRSGQLEVGLDSASLQDLVVMQLVAEARDLLGRGLHREYVRRRAPLATPRGRVDFQRIARLGGIDEPAIPSRFTLRSDDSAINRALLAGLRLAESSTPNRGLRSDARRLAHELQRTVAPSPLSRELLQAAEIAVDRRTRRYEPALRLIGLLVEGNSVTLDDDPGEPTIRIPGFALDMNRIWQRLLARVLREWMPGVEVREELSLRAIYRNNPDRPYRRRVPQPRPDFAAFANGKLLGYLDAKYRDLWQQSLPREMLYQLSLYAMAQGRGTTAILYPSDTPLAVEQRLDIHDPLSGSTRASIALRPVLLDALERLIIAAPTHGRGQARLEFAQGLVGETERLTTGIVTRSAAATSLP